MLLAGLQRLLRCCNMLSRDLKVPRHITLLTTVHTRVSIVIPQCLPSCHFLLAFLSPPSANVHAIHEHPAVWQLRRKVSVGLASHYRARAATLSCEVSFGRGPLLFLPVRWATNLRRTVLPYPGSNSRVSAICCFVWPEPSSPLWLRLFASQSQISPFIRHGLPVPCQRLPGTVVPTISALSFAVRERPFCVRQPRISVSGGSLSLFPLRRIVQSRA